MKYFGKTYPETDFRKSSRCDVCILVEEDGQEQDFFNKTQDLSENGVFISTEKPRNKGEGLTLRFALPGGPVITAHGKVTRVQKKSLFRRHPEILGMGIEFIGLDSASQNMLRRFTRG